MFLAFSEIAPFAHYTAPSHLTGKRAARELARRSSAVMS